MAKEKIKLSLLDQLMLRPGCIFWVILAIGVLLKVGSIFLPADKEVYAGSLAVTPAAAAGGVGTGLLTIGVMAALTFLLLFKYLSAYPFIVGKIAMYLLSFLLPPIVLVFWEQILWQFGGGPALWPFTSVAAAFHPVGGLQAASSNSLSIMMITQVIVGVLGKLAMDKIEAEEKADMIAAAKAVKH